MLKKRICIALLINDGQLTRTKKFVPDYTYVQSFVGLNDAVDEILLIDITRSGPSKASHETMRRFADQSFTPITMGGHIKSLDDVKRFMDMGADKVVLGEYAFLHPPNIELVAQKYGAQAAVCALDVAGDRPITARTGRDSRLCPMALAAHFEECGAGEIFLQSKDRDGSLSGYDLECLRGVAGCVKIPVVVGTSCGSAQHMIDAFNAGASGCATANIHHFPTAALRGFKQRIAAAGVEVRT